MSVYGTLESVVLDRLFPDVDVRLREGVHLCRDDREQFAFVTEAYPFLEPLYSRYGYDLVRADAGYIYLKPHARVRQATLSRACMLVGHALATLFLDPAIFAAGVPVSRSRLLELLEQAVGQERLLRTLRLVKRARNTSIETQNLRRAVDGALRTLDQLGFVRVRDEAITLRPPLFRFVEAVRGAVDERIAMTDLLGSDGDPDVEPEADEDDT